MSERRTFNVVEVPMAGWPDRRRWFLLRPKTWRRSWRYPRFVVRVDGERLLVRRRGKDPRSLEVIERVDDLGLVS